jgi:hypothetical protein
MTSEPWPPLTVSRPSPIRSAMSAKATRTIGPVAVVTCSNATLPDSDWPAIVSWTSVPSTRRYGPAGRSSATVVAPTLICSCTSAVVLLIDTPNVPENVTFGMSTWTCADRVPAIPAGETTKKPVPSVTSTIPPASEILTSAAPTRTTLVPSGRVTRSNVKSARSVWPAIVRSTSSPVIRRYGPAGRSSVSSVATVPAVTA